MQLLRYSSTWYAAGAPQFAAGSYYEPHDMAETHLELGICERIEVDPEGAAALLKRLQQAERGADKAEDAAADAAIAAEAAAAALELQAAAAAKAEEIAARAEIAVQLRVDIALIEAERDGMLSTQKALGADMPKEKQTEITQRLTALADAHDKLSRELADIELLQALAQPDQAAQPAQTAPGAPEAAKQG